MRVLDLGLVAALGLVTLLPFLDQTRDVGTHELRHAEIAREMAESHRLLVPTLLGREYADKPPVMHAIIAGLFRLSGVPSLALARVPSVVAGVVGALALYGIGSLVAGRRAALLAAAVLLGSFSYRRMARIARPDMLFVATILVGCLVLLDALRSPGARRRAAGVLVAGGAAGLATVMKGPLGVAVPAIVGVVAARRRPAAGRLSALEWALFVGGVVAVVGAWVGALWLTGHTDYLHRVVTQPDVAGSDPQPGSARQYAIALAVGFLPFTLLLPVLVHDVRRHGLRFAIGVAVLVLVVLVIVPKKRPHYLLPVYPFLALAVAEAVTRDDTRRLARATIALTAVSLASGPVWYALTPPGGAATEEPKLVMGRQVLALVEPRRPIVCMDELAEAIAFEGRRDGVSEVTELPDALREAERNGPGGYVVIPDGRADEFLAAAAGRLGVIEVERAELPVHRRVRGWRVYRVES